MSIFVIKIIACFTMLLDHIKYAISNIGWRMENAKYHVHFIIRTIGNYCMG